MGIYRPGEIFELNSLNVELPELAGCSVAKSMWVGRGPLTETREAGRGKEHFGGGGGWGGVGGGFGGVGGVRGWGG